MIEYEHTLIFTKFVGVESTGKSLFSMYAMINEIHGGSVVPIVIAATLPGKMRLGFSSVFRKGYR